MVKIGIITGSVREGRLNSQVAEYVKNKAVSNTEADFEIVDIKDYNLPIFSEPVPPAMANKDYKTPEAHAWSQKIDEFDGFIFVTPEYNRNISGALKNAIDYLSPEWNSKAAGIVAYGSTLGVSAVYALRATLSNANVATVGPFGAFSLFTDFENMTTFKPAAVHNPTIQAVIDTTVAWSKAMKTLRN